MATPPTGLPEGRPTDYKPEYCKEAVKLLRKGWAKIELCRHFKIAKSTLLLWEQTYPEFSAAINEGVDYSEGWWTKKGRTNLTNKEFNSRLYELNMMNRFGWNKKTDNKNEHDVKPHEDWTKILK